MCGTNLVSIQRRKKIIFVAALLKNTFAPFNNSQTHFHRSCYSQKAQTPSVHHGAVSPPSRCLNPLFAKHFLLHNTMRWHSACIEFVRFEWWCVEWLNPMQILRWFYHFSPPSSLEAAENAKSLFLGGTNIIISANAGREAVFAQFNQRRAVKTRGGSGGAAAKKWKYIYHFLVPLRLSAALFGDDK